MTAARSGVTAGFLATSPTPSFAPSAPPPARPHAGTSSHRTSLDHAPLRRRMGQLAEVVEGVSGARMLLAPGCRCTPSLSTDSSPTTERSTGSASPSTSTGPSHYAPRRGSSAGITGDGPRRGRGPRRTRRAARCGRRGRSAAPRFWHPGDHACAPRAGRRSATGWRPYDHAHRRCRHVRARRPCPRAIARPDGRASGHGHQASGPGPPAPVAGALPPGRGYDGLIDRGVM
jgi:hypothetical protein